MEELRVSGMNNIGEMKTEYDTVQCRNKENVNRSKSKNKNKNKQ